MGGKDSGQPVKNQGIADNFTKITELERLAREGRFRDFEKHIKRVREWN